MLFVDVRGFTSLSEKMSPSELADLMNSFYRSSTDAVIKLDGTVDKFVGDQIMAFFGAPFRPDDHAERAVQAAISIVTNVSIMSNELEVGGGVATGVAFVGNVGGAGVADFTVLGDVVNVAARLQGHASPREVLLEKSTYQHVKQWYPYIEMRKLQLKGKAEATDAWVLRSAG